MRSVLLRYLSEAQTRRMKDCSPHHSTGVVRNDVREGRSALNNVIPMHNLEFRVPINCGPQPQCAKQHKAAKQRRKAHSRPGQSAMQNDELAAWL